MRVSPVTAHDDWRTKVLDRGDAVPHFEVRTVDGDVFAYSTIWQHKSLVLITLPPGMCEGTYVSELSRLSSQFKDRQCVCVITRDIVAALPAPGALVADRWGEIVHVAAASDVAALPTAGELLEWVEYLETRCPECEGEAR
jgi:hypothetical protein